ncbi:DUF378 domain-containing protein [Clostridium sp. SYSU_GA19001]|uniref:DUF378 domain-containing protein n=1 Tax=Clostridium caldaquaticum TaxID=2940653 RepID=UPI002077171E|nr:DUF378 domain-containing protein [Clostridium caldaquaticum]MCM8710648.1 DUF378 domain-containing protein [Clostridium caldaquaticum]
MYKLSVLDKISFLLVIIGALNWGLYGLLNIDLVQLIFGTSLQILSRIIYIIIGVAGIDMVLFLFKARKSKI